MCNSPYDKWQTHILIVYFNVYGHCKCVTGHFCLFKGVMSCLCFFFHFVLFFRSTYNVIKIFLFIYRNQEVKRLSLWLMQCVFQSISPCGLYQLESWQAWGWCIFLISSVFSQAAIDRGGRHFILADRGHNEALVTFTICSPSHQLISAHAGVLCPFRPSHMPIYNDIFLSFSAIIVSLTWLANDPLKRSCTLWFDMFQSDIK